MRRADGEKLKTGVVENWKTLLKSWIKFIRLVENPVKAANFVDGAENTQNVEKSVDKWVFLWKTL